MIARHLHHPVTNRLALVAGIAVFVVVSYSSSYVSMWDLWQTSDHRHGILVFPIVAFLIWTKRHELGDLPIHVDGRGLLLILPLALAWIIARLAGVQVVEHAAALGLIPVAVFAISGSEITGKLLFPLIFILFSIPVGDTLVPYLMVVTADISTGLLRLSGIPVLREGQYLSLPGGNFVVADVCSGARYLVTGVMVSLLYGYLTYSSPAKRVVLVAVTAVTLVVTNGVRAYIVMAVASATNMQYLGGRDHIYFGWLLFGIVMMTILWIGARYADEEKLAAPIDGSDTIVARASHTALPVIIALGLIMLAITVKPLQADFGETGAMLAAAAALLVFIFMLSRQRPDAADEAPATGGSTSTRFGLGGVLTAVATVAIVIATPRLVGAIESRAVHPVDANAFIPALACRASGPWRGAWSPVFDQPDAEHALAFDCGEGALNVYVAAYASALQGRELVSSAHHVVPQGWDRYVTTARRRVPGAAGGSDEIVEALISRGRYEGLAWYWYEVDGRVAVSPAATKALQVIAMLRGRPAGGRVVVIETTIDTDLETARQRLSSAARALLPNDSGPGAGDAS